jgi:hypothetical protein
LGVGALARRCDVRPQYASRLAARAALPLDLFEQPAKDRVLQQPAEWPEGESPVKLDRESLRGNWRGWALTGIAGLSLVLVLVNIAFFLNNRTIQNEINTRQQFINQTMQLERLGQELVNALASLALRNNDEQLRKLLAEQGITLTAGSGPAGPAKAPR